MTARQRAIFISCGQFTEAEQTLGTAIATLVGELTPYEGYFAQNQVSFEGLTTNILRALDAAVGFIGVMHPRGEVSGGPGEPRARASVWVEQELAIASFIEHRHHRSMFAQLYVHESIRREGLRQQIITNAHKFKTDTAVLEHLEALLPEWAKLPSPRQLQDDACDMIGFTCHVWKSQLLGTLPGFPETAVAEGDLWDRLIAWVRSSEFSAHDVERCKPLFTAGVDQLVHDLDRITAGYGDQIPHELRRLLLKAPRSLRKQTWGVHRFTRGNPRNLQSPLITVLNILAEIDRLAREDD